MHTNFKTRSNTLYAKLSPRFLVRKIHILQYNESSGGESFFTSCFFFVELKLGNMTGNSPKIFAPCLLYKAISTVVTYIVKKVIPY